VQLTATCTVVLAGQFSVVVVVAGLTVSARTAEVLIALSASPLYLAVRLWGRWC
jgi:hypothetical protein